MKLKGTLLIVDDEANIRKILQVAFEREGFDVYLASDVAEAKSVLNDHQVDVILSDMTMPGESGYDLLEWCQSSRLSSRFVLMTAYGTIPLAVKAIREGAFEFVTKPFDLDSLKRVVTAANQEKPKSLDLTAPKQTSDFIAESPAMQQVFATAIQVAPSKATVLITGESGVGKEVVAKAIHRYSGRSHGPFVAVSCAALPDSLVESELFGYTKGAFTGADQDRPGRFELASQGTLFLDEIGEIPLSTQVKLLRVLQERQCERLGSASPVDIDVRLVTATNRELATEVEQGRFRLDLLYRLQVIEIQIPPLRERTEDILPLARHFLAKFANANGKAVEYFDDESIHALVTYPWPGNVRELENCIERAVVLLPDGESQVRLSFMSPAVQRAA
ncbi:MAG TPA: sigma-54 dependent transcriptional regulator [Fimbriimonadaceae bacterium]|nr:sigma-54 dependent transcriptional regulator [Fimbriimonadaceae bacterium]